MNALKGITGRNYTYSNEDQVITAGDVTYKYDVDGFLAYKIKGTETTEYEYATRGELMKVTLPNGNVIEYVNDPLGRRIAKKINGVITEKYLWQGMTRLLAVYDGANNLLERFVYADSRLPMAMQSGGNTFYLAYDQVGSLISMTDASGNVVRSVTYDSFGNIIQDSDPNALMPFGFAAGLYDPDTGLVRFGFREYSPEIGRWTAKDPILFAGGVDLYGYCINDPVNFIDSIGLDDTPDNSGGYWQYSQSEGRIAFIMSDGTPIYYGEGYSGHHGGVNEPLVQSTQDFGPIPRGWWYITPINHPNYRPPVMSLTPTVETETYRRSLFLIHGDNACLCQSASTGCIILEVNIREIISHSPYHFLKVVW
jgi:RHS repeat-associated protein